MISLHPSWLPRSRPSLAWLAALAAVATALAHGVNMFRYPYYENDEAVYLSQAWSVLQGKLAPYTYWYDHAPAGWIQLAPWLKLVGLHTFGSPLNGGRVAMLLIHILSVVLLFRILRRLTDSPIAAFVGAFLFGVSPMGTYFMRRILLDNIMLLWVLASVDLLLGHRQRLWRIAASGVALAVAVLSKETAVVFVPTIAAMVYVLTIRWQRRFAAALWATAWFCVVSLYPLMAALKGELFPSETLLGGSKPHVSLLWALGWQLGRTGNSVFDVQHSLFWHAFFRWWQLDPFLLASGIVATLGNVVLSWRRPACRWAALLTLPFWAYLLHGGLVLDFYVAPLVALLPMNLVVFVAELVAALQRRPRLVQPSYPPLLRVAGTRGQTTLGVALVVAMLASYGALQSQNGNVRAIYAEDQTSIQAAAVDYVQQLPADAFIAMDNYGYLDLHYPLHGPAHPLAHWYWKVERDSDVLDRLLHGDPNRIDYVLLTPQLGADLVSGQEPIIGAALQNSKVIARWYQDDYGVELWQSRTPAQILRYAWRSYLENFVTRDGRILDPENHGITTSEAQSYGLLRAVWMDDRAAFDLLWNWTRTHLQVRADALLAWRYSQQPNGAWAVTGKASAADADEDVALALLFAGRQWHNQGYAEAGLAMVGDIWQTEVGIAAGRPYLVAGDWAINSTQLIINPSYLAPYAYRIFAQIDPGHAWSKLVDTSYDFLTADASARWNAAGSQFLPTEWAAIDRRSGKLQEADPITGGGSRWSSFGSARVAWRVGLDLTWNRDSRAVAFLDKMTFFLDQWKSSGRILATYKHDGSVVDNYESRAVIGALLPAIASLSPKDAGSIYRSKLFDGFYKAGDSYYWTDPLNYYEQNWAWFGTAAYGNLLTNVWPVGCAPSCKDASR